MHQTLKQQREISRLSIPFRYGTCSKSPDSAPKTLYSNGAVSLHERTPEDVQTRSSRARPASSRSRTMMAASTATAQPNKVAVHLRDKSLWDSFRKEQTEMIITKVGRRMFPFLDFSLSGLEPDQYYGCAVEIVPVDDKRYRYHKTEGWTTAGVATAADPKYCHFLHPNSASLGRYWMEQGASFDRMKLSNHIVNGSGHIVLASMQKYRARVLLTKLGVQGCDHWVFNFPETEFITVTSYQNPLMTNLKIEHNPFAKAFRNGKRAAKRQDATDQPKRRCPRFLSPPPITRYQSPFISFLNSQESPAAAPAPTLALPSPSLAPVLPPPPLCHEPAYGGEPWSTRCIPEWNDNTLPWEQFEEPPSVRRQSLPSMSASFKVEVCGTYAQRPETSCTPSSYFEDDCCWPFPQNCPSSASVFGGLFEEVQMSAPSYAAQYDHFWREV